MKRRLAYSGAMLLFGLGSLLEDLAEMILMRLDPVEPDPAMNGSGLAESSWPSHVEPNNRRTS